MFGKKKDKEQDPEEEDLHEQMRRLQEEMNDLRGRLEREGKDSQPPRPKPPAIDPEFEKDMQEFGRQMGEHGRELGEYIKLVVADAMKGANRAMRSIFIGPDGARVKCSNGEINFGASAAETLKPVSPDDAQRLLSPLASAERIKILYLLAEEPRYHQDLMDLSGLAPGTLPHHLKQLEEAGYITQERVRGRYLITIPGRMALKLAEYLHNQMKSGIGDEANE